MSRAPEPPEPPGSPPTGPCRPAPTARERLIATGLDLFYRRGFHAVGLDQVIGAAATTKTTFYKYFESKDELALACVQTRDESWRVRFPALLLERAGDDPVDRLREVFRLWKDWLADVHFNGCLFIHACSEFPNADDPIHRAARANVLALREHIAELADHAGFEDPDGFALQYSLLMNGAIVLEVIDRQQTAAEAAGDVAEALIARALLTAIDD